MNNILDCRRSFVSDKQYISNIPKSNLFNGNQELTLEETHLEHVKSTQEDTNLATSDNILNKIKSFKKFLVNVESRLCLLGGCNYQWQSGFQRNFK